MVVEGIVFLVLWIIVDIGDQGDGSIYSFDFCIWNNFVNGDFIFSLGVNNLGDDIFDDVSFIG